MSFYGSELAGQPISIVMRISILIKTNHSDQSNLKYIHKGDGFLAKPLRQSLFHCQNVWFAAIVVPVSFELSLESALKVLDSLK